ncbi:MAG: hypothetical protein O7C63_09125 [Alphaproteobacteria bacterium]|nr:hypothetical protein [Alphaproteobacteria bacterium]
MTVRQAIFGFLLAAVLAAGTGGAYGWGHLPELRGEEGRAHLVFAVLERATIGYCTDTEKPDFNLDDLDIQVEGALKVWLAAVEDLLDGTLDGPVTVEKNCDPATLDLMVTVGPIDVRPSAYGRQLLVPFAGRTISRIWINDAPVHGNPVRRTNIFDFDPDAATPSAKQAFLDRMRDGGKNLSQLAVEFGLETTLPLTSSIYQTLIHETGHSFGLCDLKEGVFEVRCDPRFRTVPNQNAVMSTAGALNLTFDDREGIRALFNRFIERPAGQIRAVQRGEGRQTQRGVPVQRLFNSGLPELGNPFVEF